MTPPDRDTVLSGVGLHTGAPCHLWLEPSAHPHFSELRLGASPPLVLHPSAVVETKRRLVFEAAIGGASLATPEHLLAALTGLGAHRVRLVVEGPEVPAMDGSALPFAELLRRTTTQPATGAWVLRSELAMEGDPGQRLVLRPADGLRVDCAIDFAHPAIGSQRRTFDLVAAGAAGFIEQIAPARTFGFVSEAAELARAGLASGADLTNALVFDERRALNPGGLRFEDEPVRHKLLDVLGDLAVLGAPLRAEIIVERPSHALIQRGLREALARGALRYDDGGAPRGPSTP